MTVLFVCPWVPGRLRPRSLGILTMLQQQGHDITVVVLQSPGDSLDDLRGVGVTDVVVVPRSRLGSLWRVLTAPLRGRSLEVAYVSSPTWLRTVRRLTEELRPDIVHLNVARSAAAAAHVSQPVVWDLDDMRSDYYRQLSHRSTNPVVRLGARYERWALARVEKMALSTSAAVTVSSPVDASLTREQHRNVHLVRSEVAEIQAGDRTPGSLLFGGRMSYFPNAEAVRWLFDRVLPQVFTRAPEARIVVVGEGASSLDVAWPAQASVFSDVPSMEPYFQAASINLVPIFTGTGVQLKLLQSLAIGLPTICTPLVAQQAGLETGAAVVAESPGEWSDAILRLLEDESLARRVGDRGQAWFRENAGSDAIRRQLMRSYAEAAQAGAPQ